jgi:diaminopimelate epimerase
MQCLSFVKTQGIGNDFIIVDLLQTELDNVDLPALAVRLCDRNFGIGGDGLILVHPSDAADFRMQIINSDGSEAEMCGNGIRCFARYLLERKMAMTPMTIQTLAGVKTVEFAMDEVRTVGFTVNMGAPRLNADEIPFAGHSGRIIASPLEVDGTSFDVTCVSMGNPHCIIFVNAADEVPLAELGPKIETHTSFPKKTNVEFVQVIADDEIKVRVWERGAGVTLACGTGACASVVAGVLNGKIGRKTTVHLPGGDLLIDWREDGNVYMTGPAEVVFTGDVKI